MLLVDYNFGFQSFFFYFVLYYTHTGDTASTCELVYTRLYKHSRQQVKRMNDDGSLGLGWNHLDEELLFRNINRRLNNQPFTRGT